MDVDTLGSFKCIVVLKICFGENNNKNNETN